MHWPGNPCSSCPIAFHNSRSYFSHDLYYWQVQLPLQVIFVPTNTPPYTLFARKEAVLKQTVRAPSIFSASKHLQLSCYTLLRGRIPPMPPYWCLSKDTTFCLGDPSFRSFITACGSIRIAHVAYQHEPRRRLIETRKFSQVISS